jgi:hypothetical protein
MQRIGETSERHGPIRGNWAQAPDRCPSPSPKLTYPQDPLSHLEWCWGSEDEVQHTVNQMRPVLRHQHVATHETSKGRHSPLLAVTYQCVLWPCSGDYTQKDRMLDTSRCANGPGRAQ